MSRKINSVVLMSGAEFFSDDDAINDLMDSNVPVDVGKAIAEHELIQKSLEDAGVKVIKVEPPANCQDGVYTANWALVRDGKALMSRLPNTRRAEEPFAKQYLEDLKIKTIVLPDSVERFSGQGDALPCGDVVFTQSPYRTTTDAHPFLESALGFKKVIALQTQPARRFGFGPARINKITGWPDSPTYDIDLALAVLKFPSSDQKGLIAWCPSAFKRSSRELLYSFDGVDKIEVSYKEALTAYALNLVSTGETVIMNSGAPKFEAALRMHGLQTIALDLPELRKGGGSIRCSTLTLEQ